MFFAVQLFAFGSGMIRWVDVPAEKMSLAESLGSPKAKRRRILDEIFYFGQNDFQRQPLCSVSAGDVVFLEPTSVWLVLDVGFLELSPRSYREYALSNSNDRFRIRCRWERDFREANRKAV